MISFLHTLFFLCIALVVYAEDFSYTFSQKILAQEKGNVFISPYSVRVALGMALDGAKGTTREELEKVLGNSRELYVTKGNFRSFQALAIDNSFTPLKQYVDTLYTTYHAATLSVDFQAPQKALQAINGWVSQATNARVTTLVQPNDVKETTRLMLLNAVLFTGEWLLAFTKENTQEAPFTTDEDAQVTVPMMYQEAIFHYGNDTRASYLALDCKDSEYACMIVLPIGGTTLQQIEEKFTSGMLTSWRESVRREYVKLSLPRVNIDCRVDCKEALKSLGIRTAFSQDADFSRISTTPLAIDAVLHGARLKIDEAGIEATAATAVSFIIKSVLPPENAIEMRCDHPFLLVIYDKVQGAVVFVGRVTNPFSNEKG